MKGYMTLNLMTLSSRQLSRIGHYTECALFEKDVLVGLGDQLG